MLIVTIHTLLMDVSVDIRLGITLTSTYTDTLRYMPGTGVNLPVVSLYTTIQSYPCGFTIEVLTIS